MREQYIKINNLSVAKELADFVKNELLPDTNVSADEFWKGFDTVVHDLAPKNKKLLDECIKDKKNFFMPRMILLEDLE